MEITTILPGVAACVAVFLSALNLLIIWKNRASPHRESLYEKQLNAMSAILGTLIPLANRTYTVLSESILTQGVTHKAHPDTLTEELREAFEREYAQNAWLLPSEVNQCVADYDMLLFAAAHNPNSNVNLQSLREAGQAVLRAARRSMLIDRLSTEMPLVIGAKANDRIAIPFS